jgi:hypothetical protein
MVLLDRPEPFQEFGFLAGFYAKIDYYSHGCHQKPPISDPTPWSGIEFYSPTGNKPLRR